MHTGFWWGIPKERAHFEDLYIDGRVILNCIFKMLHGRMMDWINLHEDTENWQTVVKAAVKCRVPQNTENFLTVI
jgi:hypothetical protein